MFSLLESFHFGFRHPAVMRWPSAAPAPTSSARSPIPSCAAKLTPDYRLGCKRVLGSDTWYPALCADNVDVVTAGIAEVTPDGIVDADGVAPSGRHDHLRHRLSGHRSADQPPRPRPRRRTLAETWQGSPKAHLGIGVAGFPNLFMLLGPNTGLGHNSVLLMIEAQIAYLRQRAALPPRARPGHAGADGRGPGGVRRRGRRRHRGQRLDRRRLPELVHRRHRAQLDAVAG